MVDSMNRRMGTTNRWIDIAIGHPAPTAGDQCWGDAVVIILTGLKSTTSRAGDVTRTLIQQPMERFRRELSIGCQISF